MVAASENPGFLQFGVSCKKSCTNYRFVKVSAVVSARMLGGGGVGGLEFRHCLRLGLFAVLVFQRPPLRGRRQPRLSQIFLEPWAWLSRLLLDWRAPLT